MLIIQENLFFCEVFDKSGFYDILIIPLVSSSSERYRRFSNSVKRTCFSSKFWVVFFALNQSNLPNSKRHCNYNNEDITTVDTEFARN